VTSEYSAASRSAIRTIWQTALGGSAPGNGQQLRIRDGAQVVIKRLRAPSAGDSKGSVQRPRMAACSR
jgi:hypothetical protein